MILCDLESILVRLELYFVINDGRILSWITVRTHTPAALLLRKESAMVMSVHRYIDGGEKQ
jgi:hypothetical protein